MRDVILTLAVIAGMGLFGVYNLVNAGLVIERHFIAAPQAVAPSAPTR